MTAGVTLEAVAAYGRRHGVSKAAAQKWQARGLLKMREGKVWVEGSDRSLEFAGLGKFGQGASAVAAPAATGNLDAATTAPAATSSVEVAGSSPSAGPGDVAAADEVIRRLLDGEVLGIAEALQAKENGLALRQLVRARKEAESVVDVEVAEAVLFEQGRAFRDAWLNWPARAGPPIAAALGLAADKVVEVLTAHVHEQLEALGEPEADFTP